MAIAVFFRRLFGRQTLRATLMSGAASTTNGEWINVAGFNPITVQIQGITTATVELDGSCEPTMPGNSLHGFQLNNVTADGSIVVDVPVDWLKARVTSWTSGTISAYAVGSEAA